jgi:hypothetical protein
MKIDISTLSTILNEKEVQLRNLSNDINENHRIFR